jgi:geranylgeranyl pyrophosphate synthase
MIEDFLKKEKKEIDSQLKDYFNLLNNSEHEILLQDFLLQLQEFVLNEQTKRIHPILLIAAFTGIVNPQYLDEQIEQIRKVSLAVELLHNGYVIHDDLIDEDKIRRSKPTFHIQLENQLKELYKNSDLQGTENLISKYGRDSSILGGLQAYLLGLDMIKQSKFPNKEKLLAINEYSAAMDSLLKGQIIEEYMSYHNITMSIEQYLSIAELQRASLFEKSAKIGAIMAKGNMHYQIQPLSEAMLRIGQAYAIRDDILDMQKDIKNKAKKVIYILAVQNTDEEQSRILNEIYKKEELNKSDVSEVMQIFAETNAIIVAEHFSKNLVSQAKSYLSDIYPDLNKEQKQFFNQFADFIYMREL